MPAPGESVVYRNLLYLDGEQILNALSGIRLQEVDGAVTEIMASRSADVGSFFSRGGQAVEIAGRSTRDLRDEVKLRQTIHRALSALLVAIEHQIRRPGADWSLSTARENEIVELEGDLRLYKSATVIAGMKAEEAARLRRPAWEGLLDSLLGRTSGDPRLRRLRAVGLGRRFVAIADIGDPSNEQPPVGPASEAPIALLQLDAKDLLVEPADFSRRATIVAQIDRKPARRDGRHEPETIVLRETVDETIAEIRRLADVGDFPTLDVGVHFESPWRAPQEMAASDVVIVNNALRLRPLCIWK